MNNGERWWRELSERESPAALWALIDALPKCDEHKRGQPKCTKPAVYKCGWYKCQDCLTGGMPEGYDGGEYRLPWGDAVIKAMRILDVLERRS